MDPGEKREAAVGAGAAGIKGAAAPQDGGKTGVRTLWEPVQLSSPAQAGWALGGAAGRTLGGSGWVPRRRGLEAAGAGPAVQFWDPVAFWGLPTAPVLVAGALPLGWGAWARRG